MKKMRRVSARATEVGMEKGEGEGVSSYLEDGKKQDLESGWLRG